MSHLITKARRKGNQRGRKGAERSEEMETTATDRMTRDAGDDSCNYFGGEVDEVNKWSNSHNFPS